MRRIARPAKKKTIKKLASIIRILIIATCKNEFDLLFFVENVLCKFDKEFDFDVIEKEYMPDVYGRANTYAKEILIREDVYDGIRKKNPRDIFTLAHELGHYFLHDISMIGLARGNAPEYCQPEWQADVFAEELLKKYFKEQGINMKDVKDL